MRSVRSPLLALALVALVALPALAQTSGVAVGSRVSGGAVELTVTAPAGHSAVLLAITHEDPILGTVTDRVVRAEVAANGTARVRLDDLRFGANFSVRVLNASVELPSLPNVTGILNGTLLDELPTLADIEVPALLAADADHTRYIRGYPIMPNDGGDSPTTSLIVTRDGVVVAAGLNGTDTRRWIEAHVSVDGGHTYGPMLKIREWPIEHGQNWAMAETAGGRVAFLDRIITFTNGTTDPYRDAAWNVTVLDPLHASIVERYQVGADGRTRWGLSNYEFGFLPGGDILATFSGQSEIRDEMGNVTQRFDHYDGVQVWRIGRDGRVTFLTTVKAPDGGIVGAEAKIAVNRFGHVALVTRHGGWNGGPAEIWTSFSPDGGRTFGPFVATPAAGPEAHALTVSHVALDDADTIHVGIERFEISTAGGTWAHAYLHRIPATGGASSSRSLDGMTPVGNATGFLAARDPHLVARGLRVTLFWTNMEDLWMAESVDGGLTFGPSTRLRLPDTTRSPYLYGEAPIALLPDGRPLLMLHGEHHLSVPLFDPLPDPLLRGAASGGIPVLRIERVDTGAIELVPRGEVRARARITGIDVPVQIQIEVESDLVVAANVDTWWTSLDPGQTADIEVRLFSGPDLVAGGVVAGDRIVRVTARAPGSALPGVLELPVRVNPAPLVLERTDTSPIHVPQNATVTLALSLRNTASVPIEDVELVTYVGDQPAYLIWRDTPTRVAAGETIELRANLTATGAAGATGSLRLGARSLGRAVSLDFSLPIVIDAPAAPTPSPVVNEPASAPAAPSPASVGAEEARAGSAGPVAEGGGGDAIPEPVPAPSSGMAASPTPTIPIAELPPIGPEDGATQDAADANEPVVTAEVAVGGAVAVTAVAAAVGATEAGRTLVLAVAAALYSRLARSRTLEQATREGIYRRIRASPGARFEELRRAASIGSGTLAFHLNVLEREGYITARVDWTRRRYYPSVLAPEAAEARAIGERILDALRKAPGATQSDIARAVGMSRQLAAYHLAALERGGRVAVVRDGRRVRYSAPLASATP